MGVLSKKKKEIDFVLIRVINLGLVGCIEILNKNELNSHYTYICKMN